MLFVDGTFLQSRYKGQLLATTAKDRNQGLFPLAFTVVGAESEDNWRWFFENLHEIVGDTRQLTFISDQNNGLKSVLPKIFPTAYYAYCLHHLKMNLRDNVRGHKSFKDRMVFLFRECAYAPTEHKFEEKLSELLAEVKDQEARFLLITNMVDLIRSQIMVQMCTRRLEEDSWNTVLCPKMDEKLGEELDKGRTWRWQMNGFPCSHATVAIQTSGGDINDYVEDYFYTSSFREAYSQAIHPISMAPKVGVSEKNCEFVLPPNTRRPAGRPKNRRIPSRGEKIRQIKCGRCRRLKTHNKKTCQVPI
ncbi:hypothetical protein L1049_008798 [Liquidambar formosana]|uniref:MULE transposase domain-containing protein n=1 Tax=Liquidambar formosana TaxID=63359 RepID=A0AAP0SAD9_LIQFO